MADPDLIARIDALLPQTQCEKCGYPGCRPYAEAIAAGGDHNRCPPGRQDTADRLARLLGRPLLPLAANPDDTVRRVALIREHECIGCTKCIAACPVDAIVGAPLLMHTVLAERCTGCDLCLPPCPVDCIDMVAVADQALDPAAATLARERYETTRRRRAGGRRASTLASTPAPTPVAPSPAAANPTAGAGTDDALRKLRAAATTLRRQHREASQAFDRARRNGIGDRAAMQARVDELARKATEAEQALLAVTTTSAAQDP